METYNKYTKSMQSYILHVKNTASHLHDVVSDVT